MVVSKFFAQEKTVLRSDKYLVRPTSLRPFTPVLVSAPPLVLPIPQYMVLTYLGLMRLEELTFAVFERFVLVHAAKARPLVAFLFDADNAERLFRPEWVALYDTNFVQVRANGGGGRGDRAEWDVAGREKGVALVGTGDWGRLKRSSSVLLVYNLSGGRRKEGARTSPGKHSCARMPTPTCFARTHSRQRSGRRTGATNRGKARHALVSAPPWVWLHLLGIFVLQRPLPRSSTDDLSGCSLKRTPDPQHSKELLCPPRRSASPHYAWCAVAPFLYLVFLSRCCYPPLPLSKLASPYSQRTLLGGLASHRAEAAELVARIEARVLARRAKLMDRETGGSTAKSTTRPEPFALTQPKPRPPPPPASPPPAFKANPIPRELYAKGEQERVALEEKKKARCLQGIMAAVSQHSTKPRRMPRVTEKQDLLVKLESHREGIYPIIHRFQ